MKKHFKYSFAVLLLYILSVSARAQAPNISYSPSTNSYTVGTAITALNPTNNPGGGTVAAFGYSTATAFGGSYSGPSNLNVDASGNVYIPNYSNNTVKKYNSAGTLVTAAFGSGYNRPETVVADASGNIYVLNTGGNNISKFNSSGTALGTFASGFNSPYGMAIDSSGNIYVADYGNNAVKKYNSGGTLQLTITTSISGPSNVATDASGNVFVLNLTARTVTKYNSSGTFQSTFKTGLSNSSFGFWVDGANNVYVGDSGNNKVTIYGPTGTTLVTITVTDPEGIVTDTKGNLYVASYSGNAVYKYTLTGGYFISPQLPPGLSFNNTTGSITGTPTTSFSPTTYTITAYNAAGNGSTTVSLECRQTLYWTGGSNTTAWATPGNWSTGVAPITNDDVEIGTHTYLNNKEPSITAGNVTVRSITFGSVRPAPTLTVNSNTLTINNALTINTSATAVITGNASSSLIMAPGSLISVNGTKLTISTNSFTLQSDATGSASVGPVTSTNFITSGTTVNVQRYVTGGSSTYRTYRLMSSPVYAATVGSNKAYNLDYIKASTLLTGALGSTNGFDKTGNPTIYFFREDIASNYTYFGAGNWPAVSKINNSPTYNIQLNSVATNYYLMPGSGFLFFFRGDRTTNLANKYTPGTSAESVTFSASGTLNVGQIIAKDWYTPASSNLGYTAAVTNGSLKGYNLVGNPYPSNIDWDTFQTTTSSSGIYGVNIDNTIYMFDPVSKNYGAYIAGNNHIGTNNATNIIPSGEGFFVKATATGAQLIFNESAKTSTQVTGANLMLGKPVASGPMQYFRIKLIKDDISTDETMIRINSSASLNFINNTDAAYKPGSGTVTLAGYTNDKIDVSIKSIPLPHLQAETFALKVNAASNGIYKLTLKDIVAIPRFFDVWLMDNYKKDSLDMRQNITYQFYLDRADTSSYGSKRFTLVIRQNPAYAYRLINFNATKVQDARQVQVVWKAANEENYTNFTVERSTDNGATFAALAGIDATGAGTYSFLDKSPVNGNNLYRLKQEDINNTISYSKIVTIQYSNLSNRIVGNNLSIYPNPVSNNINLALTSQNTTGSSYQIKFMSTTGRLVKEATSSQPNWTGTTENLQPGTYIIQVFDNKTQNLVGENKFVKL
ncbi:T9SS type A sorting domain-containing protein [Mucilaginibacter sp. BT774]|uniref:T9SS type A sorting domain-containing protein n=1 Tax=Mucilaginibacter sp. BT774 TaxID=3062276 RepID=UPI002674D234|nr:T9SS type A sorting domain-containing protein [Mucilaginibacter sp. BT774]MDO3626980.1 T9SS type A sorting domain-containing protein [Mucilaginibacter sp. BT774]